MTKDRSHETLVGHQFGSRARAYLDSRVHAQGADLAALAELARTHPGARVLDLGCGGGHVTFSVAPHVGEVVAYDLSPEMLEVVRAAARERDLGNVTTRQGSVETLPFDDASFDIVLSRYSAHHWRDFASGLREAARVLKPGGVAGLVDAVSPVIPLLDTFLQAIEMLRDPSHVRDYAPAEWEAALAQAGLACDATRRFRVRLEFATWVERMSTPAVQVEAIRALQKAVSSDVLDYFDTGPDGSFAIDVMLFEARRLSFEMRFGQPPR
jgi:ubiquinone/menaquinone biosynthesis C-methylase UbiE